MNYFSGPVAADQVSGYRSGIFITLFAHTVLAGRYAMHRFQRAN